MTYIWNKGPFLVTSLQLANYVLDQSGFFLFIVLAEFKPAIGLPHGKIDKEWPIFFFSPIIFSNKNEYGFVLVVESDSRKS